MKNDMKTNIHQGEAQLDEELKHQLNTQESEEAECCVLLARKDLHQLAGNLLQCAPLLRLMGEIEGSKTISTRKLMNKLHQVDDYLRLKAVEVAKMARMNDEVSS